MVWREEGEEEGGETGGNGRRFELGRREERRGLLGLRRWGCRRY